VLWIPSIDPGDHHIDGITDGTFDLLHAGHLNLLELLRALGDKLILGEGISMMNHSRR
jgi:glycerol-3-phosphate cytidylyltransferase